MYNNMPIILYYIINKKNANMDSQHQNQPHTLCTKCNNFIRTQNFLIHDARCKGPTSSSQSSRLSSRIFNNPRNSNQTNRNTNNIPIPCHFCGYPQTLLQLDTHPRLCEHREQKCTGCQNNFPRSLMEQHMMVCPARRPSNYPDLPNFNPNMQQRRSQQIPGPQYRQISRNRNQYPPQYYQQQPFHPNQVRQRRQPDPFQMMDRMMQEMMQPERRRRQYQRPAMGFGNIMQLIHMLAGRGQPMQQGLSKQQIKQYPVNKYKAKQKKAQGQEDMCIICYCNFQEGQDCMHLPCAHQFHPECIQTWLQKNPTCPVCKKNFAPEDRRQQQQHQVPPGFIRIVRFG